jgi:tellurite resistance protein
MKTAELAQRVEKAAESLVGAGASVEETRAHLRAVKTIAGADGLSESEHKYFIEILNGHGMPKELIDEFEAFDPSKTSVAESVRAIPKGSRWARELLRCAIRVASVDGYSAEERQVTMTTAWHVGVEPRAVYVLEALVALERAVNDLGHKKLGAMLPELYNAIFDSES